jgi:uncharacterized membrane protein YtjA (UPF0391 family)
MLSRVQARSYRGGYGGIPQGTYLESVEMITEVGELPAIGLTPNERKVMLQWTITFLILALIAGLLGFTGVAGTAAVIAQVLFFVFLFLLVVSALSRALTGKNP